VTTLVQAVQISLEKAGFQVDLVQIGKLDDRRTWKVTLKDGASDAQRGAALRRRWSTPSISPRSSRRAGWISRTRSIV
jgi:hypothetical protein